MIRQFLYTSHYSNSFSESLLECIDKMDADFNRQNILGIIFFIDSKTDDDYFSMKAEIMNMLDFRGIAIPFNIQAQSCQATISIELWVEDSDATVEHVLLEGLRYTRTTTSAGKSIWGIGLTSSKTHATLSEQVVFSFEAAVKILKAEGMSLSDIVRQWNYIPSILNIRCLDGKTLQHYQEFNEIRQNYYSTTTFKDGYPSATGIGTRNGNYTLDFFALRSCPSVQKIGLSNPKQQDAYKYDQVFLVGDALTGQEKKTPLFERAKLLNINGNTTIYISGTASIIGQETIGIGDIRRQTEITIDNIQELIPTEHQPSIQYTYLRAYIKEVKDFDAVKAICESRFPGVSISYLQADVCRDNLLVELEGAAIVASSPN